MSATISSLKISGVTGRGVPLHGENIDTDQIMPARFLKWITFQGLEAHVFEDSRLEARARGGLFPFDDPRFAGAGILLVNRNFGCGSSREHAPQAILRFGIKAIIGESFGEIFAGNCVAIGMPCVVADAATIAALQAAVAADPASPIALDLAARIVTCNGVDYAIEIGAGRLQQFLEGTWHPTMSLLAAGEAIDARMRGQPYASWTLPAERLAAG
jgi:3-isopropylmalate/(R)-2-methylmalate dehydratase small subunit